MFLRILNFCLCTFAFGLAANAALVGPMAVTDIANLYRRGAAASLVSSNSLQSYLKFENDINDEFGDAWTDNGGITWNVGKIGQALQTTREDNSDPCNPIPAKYISHADNTRFNLTTNFTISVWVYNADTSYDSWIFSKTTDAVADGFYLVQLGGSHFRANVGNVIAFEVGATTFGNTTNETWCHVVMQLSGTNLRIKVNNGAWDTTALASCATSSAGINIGASYAADAALTGYIDGASFWKRVLTDDEITQLYNAGNKARPQLP